ncbi:TetR/AcrR family transcriptional repressor of lmrAB and yxaGH operons [Pseudomonas fluvialis]|uniref:TetR/AcrR family transcriptional repressor of lmrAB and yxaGH operons n=1 Tax=Pseudomonas fluvialis TaxID=1793966 RepID=A0A7X0BSX4_9PSED|nr:TetR/AcrR family transcriptional regulator [Pseudomonas fluvialis]MBB6342190.1 TetR/AcrR family transcriptional repressor of lmrAB and yxaGH operons [Pseudomonas fluvialis]
MNTHTLSTRDKLIAAMADALQRKGLHGVGLNELLSQAQAPKGSLYHHFPGGKTELAVAAIEYLGTRIDAFVERLFSEHPEPLQALRRWLDGGLQQLEASRFSRGCPLATVALESGPEDVEIRAALANCFVRLRQALGRQIASMGYPPASANQFASLFVALYEGGLLQARVAADGQPLLDAANALFELLQHYPREMRHEA